MIEVFTADRDDVIRSAVSIAQVDYEFGLVHLLPLLDRFGEQRKVQSKSFYSRLKADILAGCIMPPLTLAFVDEGLSVQPKSEDILDYVVRNIKEGYILDGMQRLNTLRDASADTKFERDRPLHLTIIIAERYDFLLYRMITLNNGQKPMTARHQIEMLTKGAIDLSSLSVPVVTEKETEGTKIHGAFKLSDIVEAYTAFLTNNVNNQNKKIIESKLDEILVGRVMESDLASTSTSFSEILSELGRLSGSPTAKSWFKQVNNLIGFTVGSKVTLDAVKAIDLETFDLLLTNFETAFSAINPSKVNVGKFRRELAEFFFANVGQFLECSTSEIESAFFEKTLTE